MMREKNYNEDLEAKRLKKTVHGINCASCGCVAAGDGDVAGILEAYICCLVGSKVRDYVND